MKSVQQVTLAIVVTMLALFLQGTLLKIVLPDHFVPNLCLIFVIFLAFYEVTVTGALISFIVGLSFDVSGGVLLGPWSASFTALYCMLILISRRIFIDSFPAAMLVTLFSTVFSTAIYTGLLYQFQPSTMEISSLLVESAVTAAVAPLVLWLLHNILIRKLSIYSVRGVGA